MFRFYRSNVSFRFTRRVAHVRETGLCTRASGHVRDGRCILVAFRMRFIRYQAISIFVWETASASWFFEPPSLSFPRCFTLARTTSARPK